MAGITCFLAATACGTSQTIPEDVGQESRNAVFPTNQAEVRFVEPTSSEVFGEYSFAAVSILDDELILRGEYEVGVPVTLVDKLGHPHLIGTTSEKKQHSYFSESDGAVTYSYSEVQLNSSYHQESPIKYQDYLFAIVGQYDSYSVLPFWACLESKSTYSEMSDLLVSTVLEGNTMYWDDRPLIDCNNPTLMSFQFQDEVGWLFCYDRSSNGGDAALRAYVLLLRDMAFKLNTGISAMPLVFRIENDLFVYANYIGDSSGDRGCSIRMLNESGLTWFNWYGI